MNGRAIPETEMNTFRLTNAILERITFVSRGITAECWGGELASDVVTVL